MKEPLYVLQYHVNPEHGESEEQEEEEDDEGYGNALEKLLVVIARFVHVSSRSWHDEDKDEKRHEKHRAAEHEQRNLET